MLRSCVLLATALLVTAGTSHAQLPAAPAVPPLPVIDIAKTTSLQQSAGTNATGDIGATLTSGNALSAGRSISYAYSTNPGDPSVSANLSVPIDARSQSTVGTQKTGPLSNKLTTEESTPLIEIHEDPHADADEHPLKDDSTAEE